MSSLVAALPAPDLRFAPSGVTTADMSVWLAPVDAAPAPRLPSTSTSSSDAERRVTRWLRSFTPPSVAPDRSRA